jgi:hypothetical protein
MSQWAIVHWFELTALALLALNLWFIFYVLIAIREIHNYLALITRFLDESAKAKDTQQTDFE